MNQYLIKQVFEDREIQKYENDFKMFMVWEYPGYITEDRMYMYAHYPADCDNFIKDFFRSTFKK